MLRSVAILTRIIHGSFYCNCEYGNQNLDVVVTLRAKIMRRALDLASAGTTHLAVVSLWPGGGLAPRDLNYCWGLAPFFLAVPV